MQQILDDVKKLAEIALDKISSNDFKKFSSENLPTYEGVYIIKEAVPLYFDKTIFYVGQGKNIKKRLNKYLSSSNKQGKGYLRKKLHVLKGLEYDQINQYLKNNCVFLTQETKNPDTRTLLESLLISVLRDKGDLLNKFD
jgi:hypothetical protein